MTEVDYKKIKDAIVYSRLYEKTSDKTDNINLKKRSINSYILSNLCVGFAKEFNLDAELAELIVYARDIAYPTFGEVTYDFLIKKSPKLDKLQYTIELLKEEILEPSNMNLPKEVEIGIADSFNMGDNSSKEGRLVYLLEKTVYTAQMNREDTKKSKVFLSKLEEIWKNIEETGTFSTYDDICKQIILLTDTMIENNLLDGE